MPLMLLKTLTTMKTIKFIEGNSYFFVENGTPVLYQYMGEESDDLYPEGFHKFKRLTEAPFKRVNIVPKSEEFTNVIQENIEDAAKVALYQASIIYRNAQKLAEKKAFNFSREVISTTITLEEMEV